MSGNAPRSNAREKDGPAIAEAERASCGLLGPALMPTAPRRQRLKSVPTKKTGRARLKPVHPDKAPFPSERQARCNGLNRKMYPGYVQWAVDCDYAEKLSKDDREYLSGFLEEYYKGWFLKKETQVHPPDKLREANAACARRRRGEDVLSFEDYRDPLSISTVESARRTIERPSPGHGDAQIRILAGAMGRDPDELRSSNVVEDAMVQWLDRPRRVK